MAQDRDKTKRLLLGACGGIAAGLAVAGSIDREVGGVVLLASWLAAVAALHRLGRGGPDVESAS